MCERQSCSRQHVVLWLDPLSGVDCQDDNERETLIRMIGSLSRHMSGHSWTVRCLLGQESIWLQPGAMFVQSWMDRLSAFDWDSEDVRQAEPFVPESQAGWLMVVTTGRRMAELTSRMPLFGCGVLWVCLGEPQEFCSNHLSVIAIHDWMEYESQLKQGWKRICSWQSGPASRAHS